MGGVGEVRRGLRGRWTWSGERAVTGRRWGSGERQKGSEHEPKGGAGEVASTYLPGVGAVGEVFVPREAPLRQRARGRALDRGGHARGQLEGVGGLEVKGEDMSEGAAWGSDERRQREQ